MNRILEMREKRGQIWDKAKAFLKEHQDENGMLSAEDAAEYERMEQEWLSWAALSTARSAPRRWSAS